MISYLTIVVIINFICGLAMLALRNAPARLRFYICILALSAWVIPWHLLQFEAVVTKFSLPLNILSEFGLDESATVSQMTLAPEELTSRPIKITQLFSWSWFLALILGFIMFCRDAVSYTKLCNRWIKQSELDNAAWALAKINTRKCDIRRISSTETGMTTGLFKPIIWLNNAQQDPEAIRIIVMHELTHILQRDPYWLWAINLVQRLFWWNPLVWFAARYARQQIELSCDEQCNKHLPKGSYQLQLIALTLQMNKQRSLHMPAVLQMSGSPAFNLQRINQLNEERKMKKRHLMVMTLALSLTAWVGFSNATVNIQEDTMQATKGNSFDEVGKAFVDNDYAKGKLLLDDLVTNINSFDLVGQAKIWQLYAIVLNQLDNEDPQVLAYMDKALLHLESLSNEERLSLLYRAQAFAIQQNRWDKQLNYAKRWFEIADDNSDKKQVLFFTAVSHFSLKEHDKSTVILDELIVYAETQGLQAEEQWLKILFGSYAMSKNWPKAAAVQQKLTLLYPSVENEKQLAELAYFL